MTEAPPPLLVSACGGCHGRFLPRPGPCPRCGSLDVRSEALPPEGRVLAAVELLVPAPGWSAPHRIALLEIAEDVRVLALLDGAMPGPGERLAVRRDGDRYRAGPGLVG